MYFLRDSYAFCRSKLILLLLTRARRDATSLIVPYCHKFFCIESCLAFSVRQSGFRGCHKIWQYRRDAFAAIFLKTLNLFFRTASPRSSKTDKFRCFSGISGDPGQQGRKPNVTILPPLEKVFVPSHSDPSRYCMTKFRSNNPELHQQSERVHNSRHPLSRHPKRLQYI